MKKEKNMLESTFFCPKVWQFLSYFSTCLDMPRIGVNVTKLLEVWTLDFSNYILEY